MLLRQSQERGRREPKNLTVARHSRWSAVKRRIEGGVVSAIPMMLASASGNLVAHFA